MKIFSSFDTDFKKQILDREIEKYGKNNVYVISHGKFYYYFYLIVPAIFLLVGSIFYFVMLYYLANDIAGDWKSYVYITGIIVFFVAIIPVLIKLLKKYIDYILDFLVVTPDSLIHYNQEWIFTRRWRTVDVEKIKTISVNKDGILRSLFDFWNIVILTEWDEKWAGEINFAFIDRPDDVKFRILEIVEKKEK